jgi:hypothetical protein
MDICAGFRFHDFRWHFSVFDQFSLFFEFSGRHFEYRRAPHPMWRTPTTQLAMLVPGVHWTLALASDFTILDAF